MTRVGYSLSDIWDSWLPLTRRFADRRFFFGEDNRKNARERCRISFQFRVRNAREGRRGKPATGSCPAGSIGTGNWMKTLDPKSFISHFPCQSIRRWRNDFSSPIFFLLSAKNDFTKGRLVDTILIFSFFLEMMRYLFIYLFYSWSPTPICLIARSWRGKLEFSETEFLRETRVSLEESPEYGTKIKRKVLRLRCKERKLRVKSFVKPIFFSV